MKITHAAQGRKTPSQAPQKRRGFLFLWIPLFLLFTGSLASRWLLSSTPSGPEMRTGNYSRQEMLARTERICRDAFELPGKATEATAYTLHNPVRRDRRRRVQWATKYATESAPYFLRFDGEKGDLVAVCRLTPDADKDARKTDTRPESPESKDDISARVAEAKARRYVTATEKIFRPEQGEPRITLEYVRFDPDPCWQWEVSCLCRRDDSHIVHYRLWLNRNDGKLENFLSYTKN